MFPRSANWFVVTALVFTVGFHWAVLQSVAWIGMTIRYSQNDSFAAAVIKTFDGKHPCKLCQIVKAAKQAEQKSTSDLVLKKLDFFALTTAEFYFAPQKQNPSSPIQFLLSRAQAPPTPPPLSV